MERKYYEAYDDRYRQVHDSNLHWFDREPSEIVKQTIDAYGIVQTDKILEIGCGEGRDAAFLLHLGFDLKATDVSREAIRYCREQDPEFAACYHVLDCLKDSSAGCYDFIYAVSVVHMLVEDADRDGFYRFIREHLTQKGIALICAQGDGEMERSSDITNAFSLQERVHEPTGTKLKIASTSYRAVTFDTFRAEMERNHLHILDLGLTDIRPDYFKIMYAVVTIQ